MPPEEQRQELGAFLHARRTALRPEDVGLPQGVNRRRTLGLRREELAQLAGISVSWYTRLEQGRDVQLSAKAVARLAEALQLTAAEEIEPSRFCPRQTRPSLAASKRASLTAGLGGA